MLRRSRREQFQSVIAYQIADMHDAAFSFMTPKDVPSSANAASQMAHHSLTLGQNGNVQQVSSVRASQPQELQTAVDISTNPDFNAFVTQVSPDVVVLQRMMAENQARIIKQTLLDPGNQSAHDIQYFYEHLRYPARDISDVRILIGYTVRGSGGHPMQAVIERTHQAAGCKNFRDLMIATKTDWDDVFLDLGLSPLTGGVQRSEVIVWSKRSYGDNTWDWIEAQRTGDYEKWFDDYVVHGRSALLCVLIRYKGLVREQSKSLAKGESRFI